MANMRMDKNPMPEQEPLARIGNFDEVALGYTPETAVDEAKRCLNCKVPRCVQGCPVAVHIPAFVKKIAEGDFEGAYETIIGTNAFPAVCGRVCPQEKQCEGLCVRGIKGEPVAIGRLERFAADSHWAGEHADSVPARGEPNGHKVAVIGSGPAGLTCAEELVKRGYDVTVFEALHTPGGEMVQGIPAFRLPRAVVEKEIERLERCGVRVVTDVTIGREQSVDGLFEQGFEAVFVGVGASRPQQMQIPGAELPGVISAKEFLTGVNTAEQPEQAAPVRPGMRVAVIGGGNTALDAARCAKRMGAEQVYVIYSGSDETLGARKEDADRARAEGIVFCLDSSPVEILDDGDGHIGGIRLEKANGIIEVDSVIAATGAVADPLILNTTPGLEATGEGGVAAEELTCATSRVGVFAGGDAVTGASTVIEAMKAGKKAAAGIDAYIREK